MTFDDILDQAIEMLRRRQRVSYRALKRQFDLDDAYLDDLKFEIITVQQCAVDLDGAMLVWTGDPATSELNMRQRGEPESLCHALLPDVMARLQRDERVTYRTLKYVFSLDDVLLDEIRKELTFRQLAIDEGSEGLVWTGEAPSKQQDTSDTSVAISPASPAPQPHIMARDFTTHRPPVSSEDTPRATPSDEQPSTPGSGRNVPEAERRQLTVMFCDLADSTKLSQELDPEDLREVIRAYQHTSAEVIQRFDGHIAQHLGDGLLMYFGWPRAHEDDAQRALHVGLGIVEEITTTLNPRLKQEKGVQLTVRLGVHTGPVVVGEMGGGERLENLATGETVNIAGPPGRFGTAEYGGHEQRHGTPGTGRVHHGRLGDSRSQRSR